MKKCLYIIIACICFLLLLLYVYSWSKQKSVPVENKWDCTVTCVEESSDNTYVITYSDEKIISNTGILTIDNKNDFDISVHLIVDGVERVEEISAYGVTILYQIVRDTEYKLGCHADVPEGTEIKLMVYDGEGNIDYKNKF